MPWFLCILAAMLVMVAAPAVRAAAQDNNRVENRQQAMQNRRIQKATDNAAAAQTNAATAATAASATAATAQAVNTQSGEATIVGHSDQAGAEQDQSNGVITRNVMQRIVSRAQSLMDRIVHAFNIAQQSSDRAADLQTKAAAAAQTAQQLADQINTNGSATAQEIKASNKAAHQASAYAHRADQQANRADRFNAWGGRLTTRYSDIRENETGNPNFWSDTVAGGGENGGGNNGGGNQNNGTWNSWDHLHDFTGLPMTEDGWTDLLAMYQAPGAYTDCHIIYVSNSEGDDDTAIWYPKGDAAVGEDPFHPVGPVKAYKTLAAGYAQLRDGYPDMMLLKRGDEWKNQSLSRNWSKSGISATEPLIVADYGSSVDRPIILSPSTGTALLVMGNDNSPRDLVFANLHLEPFDRDITDAPLGIRWLTPASNVIFEDCLLSGYATNIIFDNNTDNMCSHIFIHRCLILDSWDIDAHSQGIFCSGVTNLLVEGSLFDHNGWSEVYRGAEPTKFNHDLYIQLDCNEVTIRANIIARASSVGCQLRPGGIMEGNLFIDNPIAGFVANYSDSTRIIRNNWVVGSREVIPGSGGDGWGLFANCYDEGLPPSAGTWIIDSNGWIDADGVTTDFATSVNKDAYFHSGHIIGNLPVSFTNNIEHNWSSTLVSGMSNADPIINEGNLTDRQSDTAGWYTVHFADPDRNIATYNASIGGEANFNAFLQHARLQSRMQWNPEYTASSVIVYLRDGFRPVTQ